MIQEDIISLAGLTGGPALTQAGEKAGRVADLPEWTVHAGRRRAFLDAAAMERARPRSVTLWAAHADLGGFWRRAGGCCWRAFCWAIQAASLPGRGSRRGHNGSGGARNQLGAGTGVQGSTG